VAEQCQFDAVLDLPVWQHGRTIATGDEDVATCELNNGACIEG
jgi:hypothetical protein